MLCVWVGRSVVRFFFHVNYSPFGRRLLQRSDCAVGLFWPEFFSPFPVRLGRLLRCRGKPTTRSGLRRRSIPVNRRRTRKNPTSQRPGGRIDRIFWGPEKSIRPSPRIRVYRRRFYGVIGKCFPLTVIIRKLKNKSIVPF